MKRRNADCKLRRPIKRNKITEGMYGSNTFLYIKFLFLWAIVITADFMLEFRFEFLWPFWLLLRSVHDSFKYKGLAFSVLFVCIAITSDLICLFFIPVNWLFFAASTYVWVQYVWHTEKGICLPTIVLWMLFLYIEGAIRWRDSRHMPHLDLCRPFAAHCIGYPVVTLGFGFKSYVGFRIRQRKQREVAKENEFYMQLLQQALPPEEPAEEIIPLTDGMSVTVTTANNGDVVNRGGGGSGGGSTKPKALPSLITTNSLPTMATSNGHVASASSSSNGSISSGYSSSSNSSSHRGHQGKSSKCDLNHSSSKSSYHQQQSTTMTDSVNNNNNNNSNSAAGSVTSPGAKEVTRSSSDSLSGGSSREREKEMCTQMHNNKTDHHHHGRSSHSCPQDGSSGQSDGSPSSTKSSQSNKVQHNGGINYNNSSEHQQQQHHDTPDVSMERGKNRRNRTKQKDTNRDHNQSSDGCPAQSSNNHSQTSQTIPQVCESCQRLEGEVKKMRSDLQHMKQVEHDLRQKVDSGATIKSCLQAKQKENDELEKKIQDLNNSRHVDRQNLQNAEKRLGEERRQRLALESQLTNERKLRIKVEEKAAKLAECGESCKIKKRHLESEAGRLRRELSVIDEQKKVMEQQNRRYEDELRKMEVEIRNRETQQSTEMLMSALAAMQDKNSTLEKNLSAETRFKLDLFSALGEARREVEIKDALIRNMEKEMLELKGKIAQLLAVMPAMPTADAFSLTPNSSAGSSMLRLNDTPPLIMAQQSPSQAQLGLGASSIICQLTAAAAAAAAAGNQSGASALSQATNCVQQQQQQRETQGVGNASSTLDPNATAYTPKNSSSLVNGAEA